MSYPGGPPRGVPPSYAPPGTGYAPPNAGFAPPGAPTGYGSGYAPPPAGGAAPPPTGAPGAAAPPSYRPPGAGAPAFINPATGSAAPPAAGPYGAPSPAAGGYGMAPPPAQGAGMYGAPPQAGGYPSGAPAAPAMTAAPRPAVGFFSPSGGAAVPAAAPAYGGPPAGYGGPPSAAGPPGVGGPPTGAPPSAGYPGVSSAPLSMPPPPSFINPATGAAAAPPQMHMPPSTPQYALNYGAPAPGMPAGFDSGNNLANMQYPQSGAPQGFSTPGVPHQQLPGVPAGANPQQPPQSADPNALGGANGSILPGIEDIDMSITCNPSFLRASVGKIVNSQQLATNSRVPLGVVCKPMAGDKGTLNDEVEVVDFGATGIVRCKRCRTYINPFVSWTDNGRRWRCNICGMLNDVPSTYFSHLDNKGQRRDRDSRPELSRCSVEFVAPSDYMVRPPQPPVYFFVIDVSETAVASGMIACAVNAIKASLDNLPGNPRTQVGFLAFDSSLYFFNLKASLQSPQMLCVSDITDVIMPLPEDLLVNLQDSRKVVDLLLDALPTMFHKHVQQQPNAQQQPQQPLANAHSCLGPALLAAKRVVQHVGGKLCVFQSTLPTLGEGALKMRENPRLLGTDKEHTMLNAEDPWYKTQAIDFSRLQIAIDTFLFASQYTDLATLSCLSKYTAGHTYYYPAFHAPRDGIKFQSELQHTLTRATAFEAVMRVRATRGLRFSNFYGNYFIRGTDLLALPNCTADSTFALDLAYDEAHLSSNVITVQAALLYTNSSGERRIRVHTMVVPVTPSLPEMLETVDMDCAMNLLAKQAVDIAQKSGLENARQRVHQVTVEMLRGARSALGGGGVGGGAAGYPGQPGYMPGYPQQPQHQPAQAAVYSNGQQLPNSLVLLPLYAMSLQKSLVLRGGTDVRVDERAFFQQLLTNMDIEESKVFIYPRMFSVQDMDHDSGLPCDNHETLGEQQAADAAVATAGPLHIRLPAILNLSYERLSSQAIVLLENGHDLFLWIGRAANPAIVSTLFGVQSLEGIADPSKLCIMPENSDFSSRVQAIIDALRAERARHLQLHFIREGDGFAEAYFARFLIEDRANFSGGGLSYTEYHSHVTRAVG